MWDLPRSPSADRPTLQDVDAQLPDYFSDRELGPPPLLLDDLPSTAWIGISATFHRFADQQFFGAEFPEQCEDGKGISGTSMAGLRALLVSHIPRLGGWPREDEPPDTITAMDLVVFGWVHAQEPSVAGHHGYFGHDHYTFDRRAGRARWSSEINRILERNGVALRQEPDGTVVRVDTAAATVATRSPVPSVGDVQVDEKIATALRKYRAPDAAVRREALEALWDAFERIKTVVDPSSKKQSVRALIDLMADEGASRDAIEAESVALTKIGNDFQIRHHEVDKHTVEESLIDPLFIRALALVDSAARAIVRRAGDA